MPTRLVDNSIYLHVGSAVLNEVRRVMGGRTCNPGPSSSPINFNPNAIVSRRSYKSKVNNKRKERTIFKTFSVLEYNPSFPQKFTAKDSRIVLTGIVELSPTADEMSLRQSIAAVVQNSEEGLKCGPDDFQFLKRSGHMFRVPDVAPDFKYDINALKALIGQGDIYVRLLCAVEGEYLNDGGTPPPELPAEQLKPIEQNRSEPAEQNHPFERPSEPAEPNRTSSNVTSGRSSSSVTSGRSSRLSLSSHTSSLAPRMRASCIDLTTSDSDSSTHSPLRKKTNKDWSTVESDLIAIFPATPANTISTLLDFVGGASDIVIDTLIGDDNLNDVLMAVSDRKLFGDPSRIIVKEESSTLSDALRYYKHPALDMARPIYIVYEDMPAADAGGPKKQFFTDIFLELKNNHALFEGSNNQLFPVYSAGVIGSGLLKVLGRVIVHSVLQDGPGFPFLAPCIYKYICTHSVEDALQCADVSQLSPPFAEMMEKVTSVLARNCTEPLGFFYAIGFFIGLTSHVVKGASSASPMLILPYYAQLNAYYVPSQISSWMLK